MNELVPLTEAEWPVVTEYLWRMSKTQPWTPASYEAFLACALNVAFEIVSVRRGLNGWEVLLEQRPSRDVAPEEAFPGEWHSPGVGGRKALVVDGETDATEQNFFRLLERRELTPAKFKSGTPIFVDRAFVSDHRGAYLTLIYLAQLEGVPARGHFFPIDALPEPLVGTHQRTILPTAFAGLKKLGW